MGVQPSAAQFSRLLASLLETGAAPSGVTAETTALIGRLARVLLKT